MKNKEFDAFERNLKEIIRAWQEGDASGVLARHFKEFQAKFPALYEKVISDRNRRWHQQILECLNGPEPCFIVVGWGHLPGAEGVLALLEKDGGRVEQQ